jgi:hypothetical protein
MIIQKINNLPKDIVMYIYNFIPEIILMKLNKIYFCQYFPWYCSIKNLPTYYSYYNDKGLKLYDYEKFCRFLLRKDSDFIFKFVLEKNISRWMKYKKYTYKCYVFPTYLICLRYIALHEYNASKCYNLIGKEMKKKGIDINSYKNIKIIKNKWTN